MKKLLALTTATLSLLILNPLTITSAGTTNAEKAAAAQDKAAPGNIVETAVEAGTFNTLVAAVKAAGLVDALSGEGPFTVFAPTDAAFDALPAGTVETLLRPENKQKLIAILKYHVVSGKVLAADLSDGQEVATLNGTTAVVGLSGGATIGNANITATDIITSNGVIHVIDTVLIPAPTLEKKKKAYGS